MISEEDGRLVAELCSEAREKGDHLLAAQCSRVLGGNPRRGEDVRIIVAARVAGEHRRREQLERLRQNPSEGWKELYAGWQYAVQSRTPSSDFWESPDFQDVPVRTPENARIRPQSAPVFDFWRGALIDGYRRSL